MQQGHAVIMHKRPESIKPTKANYVFTPTHTITPIFASFTLGLLATRAAITSAREMRKLFSANTSAPVLYSHTSGLKQKSKAPAAAAPRLYATLASIVHSSIASVINTAVAAPNVAASKFAASACVPGVLLKHSVGGFRAGRARSAFVCNARLNI